MATEDGVNDKLKQVSATLGRLAKGEPATPPARLLIVLTGGGVSGVYSTVPVEVVIRDHDVDPETDFADDDNPSRQTVVMDSDQVEVVSTDRLDEIINDPEGDDDDEPAFFRNCYSCPECGVEWESTGDSMHNDECPGCETGDIEPYKSVEVLNGDGDGDEGETISHVGDVDDFLEERRGQFER